MKYERIEKEMHKLEEKINYVFNNISWLSKAMGAIKNEVPNQGKNASEYANEALATVGDALLKFVLTDCIYSKNENITKGEITRTKINLEKNAIMHELMLKENWIAYSYNDLYFYKDENIPDNEKVVCKKHDPYVEAIIAAIYYDSDSNSLIIR